MTERMATLRKELTEARENLALILERKAEYVLRTSIPLQLIKEERHLTFRIRDLEDQIDQARPITLLRRATKLLTEQVARAVDGMPWKRLKQRLLTQASKIPMEPHLDVAALERAADDLARLNPELALLLEALHIRGNPGQLEAVQQHAAIIAGHMLAIYRLAPGEAPDLDRLASRVSKPAGEEDSDG